jgi:NTE family protein
MGLMNITLALSGGGVKGFAHIGAIQALEKQGFTIRGIAGTSAGGLVGTLYAAGISTDEMQARLREINQASLFTHMHGEAPALFGFSGAEAILSELLGERSFDDIRIPLAVTATDLNTGLPIVIKHGRLIDAVLATSAVPGVFPARQLDGRRLVDGGIMKPVPVKEARALYPAVSVVAIVLSPELGWQVKAHIESVENIPLLMTDLPLVYRIAGRLRLAQAFSLFIHSMDLTGQMLLDSQLKLEKPDLIIRPDIGPIGLIDRVDFPELVECGNRAVEKALPELYRVVSWRYRFIKGLTRQFSPTTSVDHGA